MPWILHIKDGVEAEREIPLLNGSHTLGREAEIQLRGEAASPLHLRMDINGTSAVATDLGSSFGTEVNGRRILVSTAISSGSTLRLGDVLIRCELVRGSRSDVRQRVGSVRIAVCVGAFIAAAMALDSAWRDDIHAEGTRATMVMVPMFFIVGYSLAKTPKWGWVRRILCFVASWVVASVFMLPANWFGFSLFVSSEGLMDARLASLDLDRVLAAYGQSQLQLFAGILACLPLVLFFAIHSRAFRRGPPFVADVATCLDCQATGPYPTFLNKSDESAFVVHGMFETHGAYLCRACGALNLNRPRPRDWNPFVRSVRLDDHAAQP